MAKEIDEAALVARVRKRRAKLLSKELSKKKVVKPTASEKKTIQKRLKKKYPQMSQAGWGKPKKKAKPKKKGEAVYFKGVRKKSTKEQLKKGGLTAKELERLGIK